MHDFKITDHVIERYRERTGSKKADDIIKEKINNIITRAEEIVLSPAQNIIQLMAHNYVPAKYFKANGFVYVVVDDVVVTVHNNESRRW